jgi:UDP-glucose/GDP-mannose dehydrogenase family protein
VLFLLGIATLYSSRPVPIGNLKSDSFAVLIIGMGYVGLFTAATFASRGIRTVGIDVDQEKIEQIRKGKTPPVIITNAPRSVGFCESESLRPHSSPHHAFSMRSSWGILDQPRQLINLLPLVSSSRKVKSPALLPANCVRDYSTVAGRSSGCEETKNGQSSIP